MTWPEPGTHCSGQAQHIRASAKPRSHGHLASGPCDTCRRCRVGAGRSGPSASCSHPYPCRESGPRPRAKPNTVEAASSPSLAASAAARRANSTARYMPYSVYNSRPTYASSPTPTGASGSRPVAFRRIGQAAGRASAGSALASYCTHGIHVRRAD